MSVQHLLLIILVNLIWGSLFVVATIGLSQFPPILFTSLRFALLAVVLLPFISVVPGQMKRLVSISIVMGIAMYVTLYIAISWAENTASIAMVAQLEVPISVILGIWILREKVNAIRISGTIIAFLGATIIAFDPKILNHIGATVMITISATFYAIAMILIRKLDNVSPLIINAWMAIISTLPLLIVSYLFERHEWREAFDANIFGWGTLCYSAFVGSLIGHGGMYYLLRHHPVGTIAPFTLLTPLFAVIGSVLFLDDSITVYLSIGGLLILLGISGVNFASKFERR